MCGWRKHTLSVAMNISSGLVEQTDKQSPGSSNQPYSRPWLAEANGNSRRQKQPDHSVLHVLSAARSTESSISSYYTGKLQHLV